MPPSFIPNPVPPPNINTSVGAFEIGTLVAVALFGATCMQTYIYFERYPKDHWLIKALVTVVWALELGHTIAICHTIYTMTITWYAQPNLLFAPPASFDASILLSGFLGSLEQAWFTRRLYIFSKNIWLTGLCSALSIARFIISVTFSSIAIQRALQHENIIVFALQFWQLLTCILVLGAVNDVFLASSLAWYLKKSKGNIASKTEKVLDQLIIWVVETGAITSVATVSTMVCFFAMPTNFIYIGVYMCLAKLFANALLASLNARAIGLQFSEVITFDNLSSTGARTRPFAQPITSIGYRSQFSDNAETVTVGSIDIQSPTSVLRLDKDRVFRDTKSNYPIAITEGPDVLRSEKDPRLRDTDPKSPVEIRVEKQTVTTSDQIFPGSSY